MSAKKSNRPDKKWLATQVTAVVALLTAWVTAGAWNKTLSITLIGIVGQAIVSYLLPNAELPGRVSARRAARA
jgi:hypothetical protein